MEHRLNNGSCWDGPTGPLCSDLVATLVLFQGQSGVPRNGTWDIVDAKQAFLQFLQPFPKARKQWNKMGPSQWEGFPMPQPATLVTTVRSTKGALGVEQVHEVGDGPQNILVPHQSVECVEMCFQVEREPATHYSKNTGETLGQDGPVISDSREGGFLASGPESRGNTLIILGGAAGRSPLGFPG